MFLGLGEKPKAPVDLNEIRKVFSKGIRKAMQLPVKKLCIYLPPKVSTQFISAALEGILLPFYSFTKYKSKETLHTPEIKLLTTSTDIETVKGAFNFTQVVVDNVNLAKDICNEASSKISPYIFTQIAKEQFKNLPVKIKILEAEEIRKERLELLWSVGRGSKLEPRLLILEYEGADSPSLGLVGKGITYDSGGMSIKTSYNTLFEMKRDLTGAATMLAVTKALAEWEAPVKVVTILPLAENMVGSTAYKPGDILKSFSGKTVEVMDTDCEGRLILADALSYLQAYYDPEIIIDIATLTGGIQRALGDKIAGIFSNEEELVREFVLAGKKSGEYVWPLPLFDDYRERIFSHFADLKNVSFKKDAPGSIVAALFLQEFINPSRKWVHLDIANVDSHYGEKYFHTRGATAFGVRLLCWFLWNSLWKENHLLLLKKNIKL